MENRRNCAPPLGVTCRLQRISRDVVYIDSDIRMEDATTPSHVPDRAGVCRPKNHFELASGHHLSAPLLGGSHPPAAAAIAGAA